MTIYLFIIIIVLLVLYKLYENKRYSSHDVYEDLKNYLLNDNINLDTVKKPILWIHVPYEYNSRQWLDFGSRSSFQLNQPYLYLCVKSIIMHCKDSFHICIIDDKSFSKLLPNWQIGMSHIANPILEYVRQLALCKLIHHYGGILCPISFLCFRNLSQLWEQYSPNGMFISENTNNNITSTTLLYSPNISFFGAKKECPVLSELIEFMTRMISTDFTDQNRFLGDFDRWCNKKIEQGKIGLINGTLLGTKLNDGEPVQFESLFDTAFINLNKDSYGLWIPMKMILKRRNYEWFARMSKEQILESDFILAKYIFIANIPDGSINDIKQHEPLGNPNPDMNKYNRKIEDKYVAFWKTPSGINQWGLKPLYLGYMQKENHP
jgi:hypothetical protein